MFVRDQTIPDLAGSISDLKSEIISNWVENLHNLPGTLFHKKHATEIYNWVEQAFELLRLSLEGSRIQNSHAPFENTAAGYIQDDLTLSDVIQLFLTAKSVVYPCLAYRSPYNQPAKLAIHHTLDLTLKNLVSRFAQIYAEKIQNQTHLDTRRQLVETESLHRTTSALLEKLTLDEVLEIVCSEAQLLTGASGSAVFLFEEEGWLKVTLGMGNPQPLFERVAVNNSLAGRVIQSKKPYLTNKIAGQVQAYNLNPAVDSLLIIPLLANNEAIGVLDVVNKPGGFSNEDIRVLSLFANQAAIAIENAHLHRQAEKLAVVDERQRLARELHDSVTQSLYSLSLFTDAASLALNAGKIEQASDHLKDLANMAREAMLDMRLLIFELHPPQLQKEGLSGAIRTRLEAVEARSGIETTLIVDGEQQLPISVETELYRITQEALTNVVKHARARQVLVHITFTDQRFCLEISDNGVGFDVTSIERQSGMGLRSIQERVQQFHGDLVVDSTPGQGTRVKVCVNI